MDCTHYQPAYRKRHSSYARLAKSQSFGRSRLEGWRLRENCENTLDSVATDVRAAEGTALVVRLEEPTDGNFVALFDHSIDFANLLGDIATTREGLRPDTANEALKQARKLRKAFTSLAAIDFFPGEAQKQADEALRDLEQGAAWALSPDEPHPVNDAIARLSLQDYQGRRDSDPGWTD